ncbi:TadE/TadG family type IV pilus assembly protein [Oceanicaulis sp. MMSF_3324]|uniref:TadE/TadG family type IV pilus assembly protein n=1 Tax=Oceanicaulis sp. MMSF_3324 TaxID=3046702 RepID=UPI00273FE82C|nr:TadE/TadG family type IV pilus assembly protein [Oceanicaulis sp. MMSF_3324]
MRQVFRLFTALKRDRRGVSAVEFALLAPFMIALYLGSVQLTLGLTADRKVSQVANSVADLVTQDDFVTDSDLVDIYAAADAILNPFDPEPLALRITSVRMDAEGEVFVDWSEGDGMTPHDTDSLPDLPEGLMAPMNSIIMVEATYRFSTNLGELTKTPITLSDTAYLRPRRGPWVRRG